VHAGARMTFGPPFVGVTAPVLGFGTWAVGGGAWGETESEAERLAAIQLARERGVSFFDTAPSYGEGESERLLGRALKAHRDQVVIATKVGPRDDPRRSLEDSLRRLDSDHVDLVQLHEALDRWEWQLETLHTLQREDKTRAVGLCNATHLQLRRALEIAPVASFQAAYNLFDRDVEQRDLPLCRDRSLAFLAYRPLAAGLLTGKYASPPTFPPGDHRAKIYWFKGREFDRRTAVIERLRPLADGAGLSLSSLALRWLLARAGVTVVLAGARNRRQVEENLAAQAGPLPRDLVSTIDDCVARVFRLPRASADAVDQARAWGPRERFIVERLDGTSSAEAIAAEWTDRGEDPMVAAQVKVFVDQMLERGLVQLKAEG
jgi:aryl-alcohol dehydrogenase-like predicted oxidoreductase